VLLWSSLFSRAARARGGTALMAVSERCMYVALLGAVVGARLWYGLFNWDLYGQTPSLFLALRVSDLAWPGALLGGVLAGFLWCRWHRLPTLALADSAALALPGAQALASLGLLLSGEALGQPTSLPWGIALFGTIRHPTQLYFVLGALLSLLLVHTVARRSPPMGMLAASYLLSSGLTMLLVEALRADSLVLPGGVRAAQIGGLGMMLLALWWIRRSETATMNDMVEQGRPQAATQG
jgi:phosphatidylglycerol---prolipoprotein diacylglyceryl transferase